MANTLFGEHKFTEIVKSHSQRKTVDVPAEILEVLKAAQGAGKRVEWPVRDEIHFRTMAEVLYSAGDHLNASILPAPGRYVAGKWERVKEISDATHLRATVGKRRGKRVSDGTGDK